MNFLISGIKITVIVISLDHQLKVRLPPRLGPETDFNKEALMTKTELINTIAQETSLSCKDCADLLEAYIKVTQDTLKTGVMSS